MIGGGNRKGFVVFNEPEMRLIKLCNVHNYVTAVLGQAEEIKHVRGSLEVDYPTFLLHGKAGDPNGNETILSEG